jgi:hypothetical protein
MAIQFSLSAKRESVIDENIDCHKLLNVLFVITTNCSLRRTLSFSEIIYTEAFLWNCFEIDIFGNSK